MRDSLESAVSAGFSDFLSTSLLGDSIHDVNGSDPTAYPGTLPGTEYNAEPLVHALRNDPGIAVEQQECCSFFAMIFAGNIKN